MNHILLQAQTLLHVLSHDLLIFLPLVPPHLCRIDVRWAFVIWLSQHAHHADKDLLNTLDRRPALGRLLVLMRVVAGRVQDRNAYFAVVVHYDSQLLPFTLGQPLVPRPRFLGLGRSLARHTIWMPHVRQELHLGRRKGVVFGELELCWEYPAFEWGALWPLDQSFPQKHVIFSDGASGYAFWWIRGEGFVFFEETLCCWVRHGVSGLFGVIVRRRAQ